MASHSLATVSNPVKIEIYDRWFENTVISSSSIDLKGPFRRESLNLSALSEGT